MTHLQKLAQDVLNLEMQLRGAQDALAEAKRLLAASMAEEKVSEVIVPGSGSVSWVSETVRTQLDAKIARERLEEAGLAVPLNLVPVKASLRCHLNK